MPNLKKPKAKNKLTKKETIIDWSKEYVINNQKPPKNVEAKFEIIKSRIDKKTGVRIIIEAELKEINCKY